MVTNNVIDDHDVLINQLKSLDARLYAKIIDLELQTGSGAEVDIKTEPLNHKEQIELYERLKTRFVEDLELFLEIKKEVVEVLIETLLESSSEEPILKDSGFFHSSNSGTA